MLIRKETKQFMACIWIEAENGSEWTPTESGMKEGRIAAKYDKSYCNRGQFLKKVPEAWFSQGWVKQVRIAS